MEDAAVVVRAGITAGISGVSLPQLNNRLTTKNKRRNFFIVRVYNGD
jgi:hypothetical protein